MIKIFYNKVKKDNILKASLMSVSQKISIVCLINLFYKKISHL